MERIKDFLKKYPFHNYLLLPYVILYMVSKNFQEISMYMITRPMIVAVLFSIAVYLIAWLFFRNRYKASLYSFILLLIFSTYGFRYDLLEFIYYQGYWPFNHIHRFLVCLDIILIVYLFFRLRRTKNPLIGINAFLNTFLILIISYNFFIMMYNVSLMKPKKDISLENLNIDRKNFPTPNIYYFILDGYANNQTLKEHYNYNNRDFISYLEKERFFVQDTCYSNFYGTAKSLQSTFNLDYHTKYDLYDNLFFTMLKEKNYTINVIKSGYTVTANFKKADVLYQPSGLNELERNLLEFTILRLDDIIGSSVYYRVKNQLKSIDKFIFNYPNSQFTFVHIVSPHPPFIFNKEGKKTFQINKSVNNWEPKSKYLDQLIYISNVMKSKIKKIRAKDPNSIIIIQSDHGPYITSKNPEVVFKARSQIFNAVYGPKPLIEKFKKTNSSVNTFIHVSNYLFKSNIPLKEDLLVGKKEYLDNISFKSRVIH